MSTFEDVVGNLDAVFDTVGGDTYVRSFSGLKRGGRLVSMLEPPPEELMTQLGVEAVFLSTQVTTARLMALADLIDEGAVQVHMEQTFPLDRAGAALLHLEKASTKGKIVLALV